MAETDREISEAQRHPIMGLSLAKFHTIGSSKEIVVIVNYNTLNKKRTSGFTVDT